MFGHLRVHAAGALGLLLLAVRAGAEPPPLEAFAQGETVAAPALSPDGRYLSWITTVRGVLGAMVKDLTATVAPAKVVMTSAPDGHYFLQWCRWASTRRLLCSVRANVHESGLILVVTRLAAVDADGTNLKVLLQGRGGVAAEGQLQDQIVDWTPGKPDTVIIQAQQDLMGPAERSMATAEGAEVYGNQMSVYPALYELNVITGKVRLLMEARRPLRDYLTDHHGQPRLGWGVVGNSKEIEVDARDPRSGEWGHLMKYEAFSREHVLTPIAICVDNPDCAYAFGTHEGRTALWRMNLTGRNAPVLEFAHPAVDVESPVFANDGRLLGVRYETDLPFLYYTDPAREGVLRSLKKVLPDTYVVILDATRDGHLYLVRSSSDVDEATYYLLDARSGELRTVGSARPDLDPRLLGRMQSISYSAQDGTSIPGYLTAPPGVRAEHLPLIVMPHGGPIARDSWRFDFLRAFLASRGYAVLQMNFRGSAGYGEQWFYDAHQDWGGLTYSDVIDGTRWAVKQGIADPARVCVVGWSFGGYVALLGATRNPDLFRCAVSIAGVSDLSLLEAQERRFVGGEIVREQIGTNAAKLRADSPRNSAVQLGIPLLMIHGDNDDQVNIDQSNAMDRALTRAGKPHEYLVIKGADHQMRRESDRVTLLGAIEKFLAANLAGAARPSP